MMIKDFLAICFGTACLIYGCTAKAETPDADITPDTARHACLVIVPHASPVVDGAEDAPSTPSAHASATHTDANPCPDGWTFEAGVCLP